MMPPREGPTMERRESRLSRRAFVRGAGATGLGLVAGCGRLPWQAQQPVKLSRIGYLVDEEYPVYQNAFLEGLHQYGYVEGENILIEWRSANGNFGRLPAL